MLPWMAALLLYHFEAFGYLVDWTSLIFCIFIYTVAPMFLWTKSLKEAQVYETNYRQSVQMIYEGVREEKKPPAKGLTSFFNPFNKDDGIPPMEQSVSARRQRGGFSTSKYLMPNDEEEPVEQLSNLSDAIMDDDHPKFDKFYNMQGHYSAQQSITKVFCRCCGIRFARNFVKVIGYLVSACIFVFMYLSIADGYAQELLSY
mmetsp:Transcript_28392/g.21195  ORF Transcript_28392/g.21195 Transcript_28392/m.21195 type:complete len:202 (-) Transcript_28392:13-618(-)